MAGETTRMRCIRYWKRRAWRVFSSQNDVWVCGLRARQLNDVHDVRAAAAIFAILELFTSGRSYNTCTCILLWCILYVFYTGSLWIRRERWKRSVWGRQKLWNRVVFLSYFNIPDVCKIVNPTKLIPWLIYSPWNFSKFDIPCADWTVKIPNLYHITAV